mmetsp:Transcript_30425/g.61126  ORF Transcript_30425/g.61126 Transcript_30425/m.61126 type:complete len:258 (+) Transcript_30425:189-962(+)
MGRLLPRHARAGGGRFSPLSSTRPSSCPLPCSSLATSASSSASSSADSSSRSCLINQLSEACLMACAWRDGVVGSLPASLVVLAVPLPVPSTVSVTVSSTVSSTMSPSVALGWYLNRAARTRALSSLDDVASFLKMRLVYWIAARGGQRLRCSEVFADSAPSHASAFHEHPGGKSESPHPRTCAPGAPDPANLPWLRQRRGDLGCSEFSSQMRLSVLLGLKLQRRACTPPTSSSALVHLFASMRLSREMDVGVSSSA